MPDSFAPLAILGPTASGKSTVALALATERGGDIVSCDSVQVYRDFVIGCAKPSAEERAQVPHHLLDVVGWNEPFDAARYAELARAALDDIQGRGRVPIVCGGTGLYLRALRWGLVDLPRGDADLRARLEAEDARDPGVLYRRLTEVDRATAVRTEPHNLVHVMRALEIYELTGRPASELRAEHGFRDEVTPLRVVALRWPKDVLRERIVARTRAMVSAGLLDEVEALLARGVSPTCRPMRSVGYREACDVVRDEAPREGLEDRIAQATWAYARRQLTWLRRERDVSWIDLQDLDDALDVLRR